MLSDVARIKESLDKYIVRPANFFGLGGFVFDIEAESTVTLHNDITDHYAENNTVIQDMIATKPKRVTLKGYVGELTDLAAGENGAEDFSQKVVQKLTVLNGLLPELSAGAQQVKNIIANDNGEQPFDIGRVGDVTLNNVLDIYSVVRNFTPPTNKQEAAYQYFSALRQQKILLSIQTPFEFMTNMAIESVISHQSGETFSASDFTITLKEIRFADTATTALSAEGRAAQQISFEDSLGNVQGTGQSVLDNTGDDIFGVDVSEQLKVGQSIFEDNIGDSVNKIFVPQRTDLPPVPLPNDPAPLQPLDF